ncbi:MAG: zf-TFIIB domain-containing protein [Planctomycetota bacterium]
MDLIACKKCHRQFDVSGHKIGERVRCLCDEVFEVQKPKAHQPRILRCSTCAGQIEAGAKLCPYCQGAVAFSDRDLTSVCPECYARIPGTSKFCTECGTGIQPQSIRPVPMDRACPRCEGELQTRVLNNESIVECSACTGVWIVPGIFDRICEDVQRNPIANVNKKTSGLTELERHEFRYLDCLTCSDKMVPKNFGGISGIMIDVCREHGIWLDAKELEAIVEFLRQGGLQKSRDLGFGDSNVKYKNSYVNMGQDQAIFPQGRRRPRDLYDTIVDAADVFLDLFR